MFFKWVAILAFVVSMADMFLGAHTESAILLLVAIVSILIHLVRRRMAIDRKLCMNCGATVDRRLDACPDCRSTNLEGIRDA